MKITGIKRIAGDSKTLKRWGSHYFQIIVELETGRVFYEEHVDFGRGSYLPDADGYETVGYLDAPATMEEIKEMVAAVMR